jgi:hypothetical protein
MFTVLYIAAIIAHTTVQYVREREQSPYMQENMAFSLLKLFSLFILQLCQSNTINGLILETSSTSENSASFITINDNNISLTSLTTCLRFWVNTYIPCTFVEITPAPTGMADSQLSPIVRLGIDHVYSNTSLHRFTLLGQQDFVVASWSQMLWHSICLSYDQKMARVTFVSNGAIVSDFVDKDLVNFTASPVTGLQVNIMQNMNGKFTDLHIWNYTVNCKYLLFISLYFSSEVEQTWQTSSDRCQ